MWDLLRTAHRLARVRMAAVDPLRTSDHPSCSCSLWAGAHLCLHHLQSQAVYLSALLFSSQAPSWWARQPASLVGRNQEFWAQKHLAQSPPVTYSQSLCRHSWLLDTLSSLVMCLFIVERKQNHSQLNTSVRVCNQSTCSCGVVPVWILLLNSNTRELLVIWKDCLTLSE